jgi:hypothetical protein
MKFFTWFLIVVLLGAGVWFYATTHRPSASQEQDTAIEQELAQGKVKQDIRAQIEAFGSVLQNVSLLSPTAAVDIEKLYTPFVTRSLRANWSAHPDAALGRQTSSPWPDHIDVISIDAVENNTYAVRAMIVYMTSEEVGKGGDAGTTTVQFVMINEDGVWKIDSATVLQQNKPNTPRDSQDRPQLE